MVTDRFAQADGKPGAEAGQRWATPWLTPLVRGIIGVLNTSAVPHQTRASAVENLVHSAWRRRLLVLTTEQVAFALAIVCGGAVVMLLVGTQILDWYWLVLLAAVGSAIAAVRVRQRLVQRYEVARAMDERLNLSDSLSTAWFLLTEPAAASTDSPAAIHQIRQAERIAAEIQPVTAFPMAGGRAWAVTGAMIAVIFGLFAVRYLVNSTLSLRPALVPLQFSALREPTRTAEAQEKGKTKRQTASKLVREILPGTAPRDVKAQETDAQKTQPSMTDPNSDQKASAPSDGKSSLSQSATQAGKVSKDGTPQSSDAPSGESGAEQKAEQRPEDASAAQQKGRDQNQMNQQQSPGLMDKMKDALSSLMAKMKPNSASDSASRDGKNTPGDQQGKNQNSSTKNEKTQSQDGQKAQGAMDAQSSAQASAVEKAPQSAVGSSDTETPQGKANDPQSGAGRQDGQKDIKEADQLRAMGKLAEIIGKRSASLTGEIEIEKPSEQQQLQTQYSGKVRRHSNLGGEINRDEVPAEYQQYVREYMNQVHKQANSK